MYPSQKELAVQVHREDVPLQTNKPEVSHGWALEQYSPWVDESEHPLPFHDWDTGHVQMFELYNIGFLRERSSLHLPACQTSHTLTGDRTRLRRVKHELRLTTGLIVKQTRWTITRVCTGRADEIFHTGIRVRLTCLSENTTCLTACTGVKHPWWTIAERSIPKHVLETSTSFCHSTAIETQWTIAVGHRRRRSNIDGTGIIVPTLILNGHWGLQQECYHKGNEQSD